MYHSNSDIDQGYQIAKAQIPNTNKALSLNNQEQNNDCI